jgi:outer membrane protein OmpA-like peptidoglycan-associated protein
MRNFVFKSTFGFMAVVAVVGLFLTGCATKSYVNDGMSAQEAKLADLETEVESQQRELRETGQRLDSVADTASQAQRTGEGARSRADEAFDLAKGKLLYKVVLSDVAGTFEFDSDALSDDARRKLDQLAGRLKKENQDVYLEIEGHTDSIGKESYNLGLGWRRAEAVRRHLNEQQGIPLFRMSVITYGEAKPVADNSTREGRAKNRRVEIRVLS